MKKVIHYPKLKNYFSSSSEFSKKDALVHLEVRNFNLLNGLLVLSLAVALLSYWNPLLLTIPLSILVYVLVEFIELALYCRKLEIRRVLEDERYCEGERLKIKYKFNLPLKFRTTLFEDFEGVSSNEQVFKIKTLKNSHFEKNFHLNQGFGEFRFKDLNIVLSDYFELFTFKVEFQKSQTVHVDPYIQQINIPEYESLSDAKSIGDYEFIKRGISPIFYGLREYRYGDPYKFINWKASTKMNKILVNEYENIQSLEAMLYIDLNPKHHIGQGVNSTWEYCRDLSLSIAQIHSNKSHLLQVFSSDFISENTQASIIVDDLKHYLHFHQKTFKSQGRTAKDALALAQSAASLSFVFPLGVYKDIIELFDEIIRISDSIGKVDIYLIDAFEAVKKQIAPEYRSRVMSEQKNSLELIERTKTKLLRRGVNLKICKVEEPHNIGRQTKAVS